MSIHGYRMSFQNTSDPSTFYICTIASFLESQVPTYVENLEPIFKFEPDVLCWLERIWLPEEAEHGRQLRAYVENAWPEFDWQYGFEQFSKIYVPLCAGERLRPTAGLEALARCVTETAAAMMYRCIANYAVDDAIKGMFSCLSTDEIRHYTKFRKVHYYYQAKEKQSLLRRVTTVMMRSDKVRNEDLASAFQPINDAWNGRQPFVSWSYDEFLQHVGRVMREHFPFEEGKRMLFYPLRMNSRIDRTVVGLLSVLISRRVLSFV